MKLKFNRLIPRTQDWQYEKEQNYSMLISSSTNFVPLGELLDVMILPLNVRQYAHNSERRETVKVVLRPKK